MNKITKLFFLFLAFLGAASLGWAQYEPRVSQQSDEVGGALEEAALAEQKVHALGLSTLYTTWERCDVLQSRARGNGKRVRVVKPWTCEQVTTNCAAVLNDGKAFASASCYYAAQKKDQQITLQSSRLVSAQGQSRSLTAVPVQKVKDFVVFHLP